jgi:hypothetical protein
MMRIKAPASDQLVARVIGRDVNLQVGNSSLRDYSLIAARTSAGLRQVP